MVRKKKTCETLWDPFCGVILLGSQTGLQDDGRYIPSSLPSGCLGGMDSLSPVEMSFLTFSISSAAGELPWDELRGHLFFPQLGVGFTSGWIGNDYLGGVWLH